MDNATVRITLPRVDAYVSGVVVPEPDSLSSVRNRLQNAARLD